MPCVIVHFQIPILTKVLSPILRTAPVKEDANNLFTINIHMWRIPSIGKELFGSAVARYVSCNGQILMFTIIPYVKNARK